MLLPSPSISCYSTRLRYYNLDSTYPKKEGRSGPCRKKTPRKDTVPSGPLFLGAATSSMAIAAGGLSLVVETDRLGFLQQENKASWRNVALHWRSPASSSRPAVASPRTRRDAGPCWGGVAAGLRVSSAQNLATLAALECKPWPSAGGLGLPAYPRHLRQGSFPRVCSFTLSPRRSPGMGVRAEGC